MNGNDKVILCATDFTASSDGALRYASKLALQIDATLLVVHVEPPGGQPAVLTVMSGARAPIAEGSVKNRGPDGGEGGGAGKESARPRQMAPDCEGVKYEYVLREGDPVEEILKFARETRASHIVMGSDGHPAFRHAEWGHTAERVVHNAPCPVTVVKNEGLDATSGV